MTESVPPRPTRLSIAPLVRTGMGSPLAVRLRGLSVLRLLVLTSLLLLTGVVFLERFGRFSTGVLAALLAIGFGLAAVFAFLLRRGKNLSALAISQLIADQILWTTFIYMTGGLTSAGTFLYGLTAFGGAILLGPSGALWAGTSGIVCYLALASALTAGWLPLPPDQPARTLPAPEELLYGITVNAFGIALVALLAGYLAHRLKLAGGRIVEANLRADRAERLAELGKVAAALAHEIRNPLGSIRGSAELLRASPGLLDEDRRLCEILEREASRLNDLVEDMMDLSREPTIRRETIDLTKLTREVITLASASGRGSDVAIDVDAPEPVLVSVDPGQIRQVVWNLVRNAIQASPPGTTISISVLRDGSTVRWRIADQGEGIAPEMRGKIFDAFTTARTKGVGIGLAVVKRIVEAHGLSIQVHGDDGKGAEFIVEFTGLPQGGRGRDAE